MCIQILLCIGENHQIHPIWVTSEGGWRNNTMKPPCFNRFAKGMLMGAAIMNSFFLNREGYKICNFPRKREMGYSYHCFE